MIDIPELQLIAVCFLGFVLGALFLPYFLKRPILFALVSGTSFFAIRYLVFVTSPEVTGGIPGNGIASAAVMWVIYIAMMILGRVIVTRRWGNFDEV